MAGCDAWIVRLPNRRDGDAGREVALHNAVNLDGEVQTVASPDSVAGATNDDKVGVLLKLYERRWSENRGESATRGEEAVQW